MAQMRPALAAQHFGAHHAVTMVGALHHGARTEHAEKAGPAASGIEFGIAGKQRLPATDAVVGAVRPVIVVPP